MNYFDKILAPFTGWTFSHKFVVKTVNCKQKRGRRWLILKEQYAAHVFNIRNFTRKFSYERVTY